MLKDELTELLVRFEAARQEIRDFAKEKGAAAVAEVCKPIFETPIVAISWTQYTPGFCDGDPCTFLVGELQYTLVEGDVEYEEWSSIGLISAYMQPYEQTWHFKVTIDSPGDVDYYTSRQEEWRKDHAERQAELRAAGFTDEMMPVLFEAETAVGTMLHEGLEFLEDAFGDGYRVIVTRDGVTTEEYDCGY